jgi:hypothetical protein
MQDTSPQVAASVDANSLERDILQIEGKSCFVIMPFGVKTHPWTGDAIDFDRVYEQIIKPAAEVLKLKCVRADEERGAGLIHKAMVDRIIKSDVAIVDITTLNPNVLYELGIRHTAKRSGTIIIRRSGDPIPFNINGMRAFDYGFDPEGVESEANQRSRESLITSLRTSLIERNVDSLVHSLVPRLNVSVRPKPFPGRHAFVWRSRKQPGKELAIIRGHIMKIDMVDAWVNHENTKMQMGRFHDNSISACVRYFGSRRDRTGMVTTDTIDKAIKRKMGRRQLVEPGTVIITRAGDLYHTNRVSAVIHVAAQHGEPGNGYATIRGYADCVMNVLDAIEGYNASWSTRWGFCRPLDSVLFPLMGTQGERDAQEVTDNLVRAARDYLETWPKTAVKRVCFLAYTDADDELCETAFRRLGLEYVGEEAVVGHTSA